jgi:hypothetical protein
MFLKLGVVKLRRHKYRHDIEERREQEQKPAEIETSFDGRR